MRGGVKMDNLNAIMSVVETLENSNFIWFMKEKQRYNNFNSLYENEGNNVSDWSEDHIRMENYLRTNYRIDRGINQRDFNKIKNWGMEQYREWLAKDCDKKFNDIIDRIKKVVGYIQETEMLEYNVSGITRVKITGVSSDCLVVFKFTEKNRKMQLKTYINETARYF